MPPRLDLASRLSSSTLTTGSIAWDPDVPTRGLSAEELARYREARAVLMASLAAGP